MFVEPTTTNMTLVAASSTTNEPAQTQTPCNQKSCDLQLEMFAKKYGVQEMNNWDSLVANTAKKLKMTLTEVCDTTTGTLKDIFTENNEAKESIRAMMSNSQTDPMNVKIKSLCTCSCARGRRLYLILSTS